MANSDVTPQGNTPQDDNQLSQNLKQNNKAANGSGSDDEQFPGYPHYPASEDIMSTSKEKRVDVDVENLPKRGSDVKVDLTSMPADSGSSKTEPARVGDMDDDDVVIVPGTDADVTSEDMQILEGDFDDTEQPRNRVKLDRIDEDDDIDEDLDIPGTEMDDANESIGEEDEENNYYSLGGDRHENLDEDSASTDANT